MSVPQVWDPGIRHFHWTLVTLVVAGWLLGKFGPLEMTYHFWCGYGVAALLVFRVVWGVIGSPEARFATFVKGPGAVLAYVRRLPARTGEVTGVGHNPLGGWMVLAMLLVLAALVATGLTMDPEDYINVGPLSGYVPEDWRRFAQRWHYTLGNVLLVLVGLHLCAMVFYRVWKHKDLIRPMLGRK